MLRGYQRRWLTSDLVAGLVLTTLLVPQGMAYAELAGLPAATGLYTTVACLVAYAVFGPSRILVLGPDSAVSPLIFAAITPLVVVGAHPGTALALAGMLALLVGAIEIGLGVARLGFVADLLSKEVKVGYMNGLAVVIVVGQLPKLFGFSTDASGVIAEIRAFVTKLDERVWAAVAVGVCCLLLLFLLPKVTTRVPAILVVIVGATLTSKWLDLSSHGVSTVGALPRGLPAPEVPWTSIGDVGPLLIAALGITLVSLADTIATSASFAARRGESVSADKEMIGVGAANVAAGLFQGFTISSSASRTAVADNAKAKTQVTGLVGAAAVVLLLVLFNSILAALPQPTLAAVVIAAAVSLADVGALRRYWRVRRSAVVMSLTDQHRRDPARGAAGHRPRHRVVDPAVLPQQLVATRRSSRPPRRRQLARGRRRRGRQLPGIVVFRWEAPLFFANSGAFRRQVWKLVERTQAHWVVLQCEAVTDIDVTAADMMEQLDNDLDAKGVYIAFVELRSRLHRQVARYGLFETALNRDHFYESIDAAVAAVAATPPGDNRRE